MSALFDLPVAATLNQRIPLPLLMKAAQNRSLPENLRHALLTATWARSAVLGNSAQARALGPQLGQEFPELVKYVSEYNSSPDDSSREFAAVFAMLHFPGVRPYVNAGVLREAPLAKIDDFRDNWWGEDVGGRPGTQNFAKGCGAWREWRERITAAGSGQAGPPAKTLNPDWPSFLSSKERNAADSDWNRLQNLGPAPNYFGRVVLAWAKAHREDPRVPEALHLVVRSSRYGCNNRETGLFSRQAFELLHRRYPNSEWANKTTHWFE